MKSVAFVIVWMISGVFPCGAQGKPTSACEFAYNGFALSPGEKVQIAEVAKKGGVQLEACGASTACIQAPVAWQTPVQIYRQQGEWTCGYVSGRDGAGPAWIRTENLRVVSYDEHPPLAAWVGAWSGGEVHVRLRAGSAPGTLQLVGSAVWHGKFTSNFGDTRGSGSPVGNHLHFVEEGPDSCTIDMTLLGRYILAEDNMQCGGMNVRFQGIWRRVGP